MQSVLGAGVLVMVGANAVVGVRLLSLARRTGELPELAMGGACLLLGVVGYPLSIAGRRGAELAVLGPDTLLAVGLLAQDLACLGIWLATWRIFRRDRAWAAGLVAAAGLAFAASLAFGWGADAGAAYWLGLATRAGGFVWTAVEAWRYALLLARRVPLGLADPAAADRVRLWAISSSGIVGGFAVFTAGRLAGLGTQAPLVLAGTSVVGIVSGVALWLAFVPPAAYLRLVRQRAARSF